MIKKCRLASDWPTYNIYFTASSDGVITEYEMNDQNEYKISKQWKGYNHGNKLIPIKAFNHKTDAKANELSVLTGSCDGNIHLFKQESETATITKKVSNGPILALAVSQAMVAIGCSDGSILIMQKSDIETPSQ